MRFRKNTVELARARADRALELYEQGLKRGQIAERLRVPPVNVSGMIQNAHKRRAAAAQEMPAGPTA